MADLKDLKADLIKIREAVILALPEIALKLTLSAKALAERKIKDVGFGRTYSGVKYPAWFLHGKELNLKGTKFLEDRGVHPSTGTQGEAKKKRKKKGEEQESFDTLTNWKEFRDAQGLQTEHVDLSYSNKMFAAMGPVNPEQRGDIFLAPLGGTNKEAQDKMNWNFERYGDFIGKSLDENDIKILEEVVAEEVVQIMNNFKPQ